MFISTKILELGSCAFRQWKAEYSHCKFIHGYRLLAKFWFGCRELDNKNWVVDFGGLDELKKILQHQFDHTLCVAGDDPHLPLFEQLHDKEIANIRVMKDGVGIEKTAQWCFNVANTHIQHITKNRCWVEKVEVWEHEKNSAIYTLENKEILNEKKHIAEQYEFKLDPTVQESNNNQPRPAAVGNKVTTGWSNPFGGTSWGS